jgi:glycerol uptake facilitator-like aquaporin
LILYIFIQFCGAYLGIFFTWLILKFPAQGILLWPNIANPSTLFWYFSQLGNIYYAKIVFLEILNTFTFVLVYLLIIYKPSLRTVDEIIKGLGASITLWICYALCADSGACLNPALALAQTTYQVGFLNTAD